MTYHSSRKRGGGRSHGNRSSGHRKSSYDSSAKYECKGRTQAKRIASSKLYTSSGERIRNPDAYTAAGGRAYSSNGSKIRNPTAYQNAIEASVRQNTNDPKFLYHYTDKSSAEKIAETGLIKASQSGAMGHGTYMTAKQPRCSLDGLLTNNYGQAHPSNRRSQVDCYVRVDADRVRAENGSAELGRNVWKVPGSVDLAKTDAFIGERQSKR